MSISAVQHTFIKHHLNSENFNKREVVEETALMFSILVESYVKTTAKETFYNLPYKDISALIFDDKSYEIKSDAFDGFITTVKDEIINTFQAYGLKTSQEHIIACYEKFASHIELALIQKKFMLDSAKEANNVANIAKKQAEFAKKQAKKAKDMSSNMVTNFVTILGVFATIIITVFGGINIINSTVKLLEGNNKLVYLIFIVSFLMICLLTLVQMLASWISSLNGKDDIDQSQSSFKKKKLSFYLKTILSLSAVLVVSGICIAVNYDQSKRSEPSKENTQQNEAKTQSAAPTSS